MGRQNLALLMPFLQEQDPPGIFFQTTKTIDRAFSGHPAWGGGNVGSDAFDFMHLGERWRLYQVIPFDGPAIQGVLGNARIHIRNRDKGRGQNTLAEMPTKLTLSGADWTGLPWTFTRTTSNAGFSNAGSGNTARKSVVYTADRNIPAGTTAASLGIADPTQPGQSGESFTIRLDF